MTRVHVLHDRRDGRVLLAQSAHEALRARELIFTRDHRDHDFARRMPDAHLHMAKETLVGVFVVRFNAETAHEVANRKNNALGFAIFEQTFVRIDHAVRSAFVHAAQNTHLTCFFVPYANIGRHDLVAIVTRVVHT